jgi:hypothetical protein
MDPWGSIPLSSTYVWNYNPKFAALPSFFPIVYRNPLLHLKLQSILSLNRHTLDLGSPCAKIEIQRFQLCVDSAGNRYVSDDRPVAPDHAFAPRVFAGAVITHRVMRLKSLVGGFWPVQPSPTCASKDIRLNTVFRVKAQNSPDAINRRRIVSVLCISYLDSCN